MGEARKKEGGRERLGEGGRWIGGEREGERERAKGKAKMKYMAGGRKEGGRRS